MSERELTRVTAFVVRPETHEVLLARHPFAGIQFPSGGVESGETPTAAAARIAADETGLTDLDAPRPAGSTVDEVVGDGWLVGETAPVFFRPDGRSNSWAILRRGISVTSAREADGFVHVTYEEVDQAPSPQYLTARITGWVRREALTRVTRRHFFLLACETETLPAWEVSGGGEGQVLFWAPIDCLPAILPPQDQWIPYLTAATGGAPLLSAMMRKAAA